ncbi:SRPBCC family protein [Caulobacter endophyticus]|uniref:SRPBCC family protein n=1 Tax=Caulobacter endophyticus TaxID=2172652 RepID=UPI00240F1A19|nr:SRPBCC family protein [Caulobacter endophyticus]MDG2528215.1 SRPBCC family protein [Caulobacter endophyticus]
MSQKTPIPLADQVIEIARPADEVFAFVANHENYARWYPGALKVVALDDLPHGAPGKAYEETLVLPSGRTTVFTIRTIEVRAPDLFVTEGELSPVFPRMEIRLTSKSPQVTELRLKFLSRSRSFLLRLLIALLVRGIVSRQTKVGLSRLQSILA